MDIYAVKELVESHSNKPQPWLDDSILHITSKYDIVFDHEDHEYDSYTRWGWGKGELNMNYGGEFTRQAHKDGKYDHMDRHKQIKEAWKKRDKKVAQEKLQQGFKKWKEKNPEKFLENQRKNFAKGLEVRRLNLLKLEYEGVIYYGWAELSRATGKSKYFLQRDEKVVRV